MTKKHFQQFADMVKTLDLSRADRAHVAFKLCSVFENDNPRFDRQRFLDACGGLQNT